MRPAGCGFDPVLDEAGRPQSRMLILSWGLDRVIGIEHDDLSKRLVNIGPEEVMWPPADRGGEAC